MTRRDNQPKYYDCARHKSLQSSHPPRHKCLILFVARFSPRLSLYSWRRVLRSAREGEGRVSPLCPRTSDVDLFGDAESVIHLDTEVPDGALDLRVPQQQLNGT